MVKQGKQKSAQELFDHISLLSEEAIHAGWQIHIEYCLWEKILNGAGQYYMLEVNEAIILRLNNYAQEAGGWWSLDNNKPVLLSFEAWNKLYEQYPERRIW
jgi:hypothetical protein